jgi:hypothetical protein
MAFARACIAKAIAKDDPDGAAAFASARWGEDSAPVRLIKGAVGAATAGSGTLSGDGGAADYMAAVFEKSAVGRMMLRRRPPGTRYLVPTGTTAASFVGEGKSIPVLPFTFDAATMQLKKVAALIVVTRELLESADPVAEQGIRADLVNSLAEAIDAAFFDPDNAGSDDVPASVTNGLDIFATGTYDLDDSRDALAAMIENFAGDLTRAVFVGRPELFAYLNSLGFDDVGVRGGTLVGAPAIATRGVPKATGYYSLVLVDPDGIAFAADPAATQVMASQNAALQMDSAPTNDAVTPTPTNLVSCWQSNATAIKALAFADWSVERSGAVSIAAILPRSSVS